MNTFLNYTQKINKQKSNRIDVDWDVNKAKLPTRTRMLTGSLFILKCSES